MRVNNIFMVFSLRSFSERRRRMTTADHAMVIGVFDDGNLAQQAIDELRQVGFRNDHIGFAVRGDPLMEAEISTRQQEAGKQHVVVMVRAEGRQQEALDVLRRCGASHVARRSDLLGETKTTTTSSREYDPITGPQFTEGDQAPVSSSGYGLERDPTVETDATAKTYDKNIRPPSVAEEDGSQDSSFERPLSPGTVQAGDWDDPNIRHPRIA
jgi:hypothetical protein